MPEAPTDEYVQHWLTLLAGAPSLAPKDLNKAISRTVWFAEANLLQVTELLTALATEPLPPQVATTQLLTAIFRQLAAGERKRRVSPLAEPTPAPCELIRQAYAALSEQDAPRSALLAWLTTAGAGMSGRRGDDAALAAFVELLVFDPPHDEQSVAEYFAPLFQPRATYDPGELFPALWAAVQHPELAAAIVDLANFLFRQKRTPEHPAASRRTELAQLLGESCQLLGQLEEQPPEGQSPQELSRLVSRSIALAVALCDALALLKETAAIGKLNQALALRHRRLKTEAAAALARMGDKDGEVELLDLAAEPIARLRVLAYARELNLLERVPPELRTPAAEAESELCVWLAEPTQFGIPPMHCELVDERQQFWPGFDEPVACFLFRFTYSVAVPGQGELTYSNVGIAGPVTHAFTADLGDLAPDNIYAAFAGWQAEHAEILEFDVERLSKSERIEATRLERRLHDAGFTNIEPKEMGYFFGDKALIAAAQREGVPGIAVVDFENFYFYPTRDSRRSLGPREAYCIYKGRKLLKAFNV